MNWRFALFLACVIAWLAAVVFLIAKGWTVVGVVLFVVPAVGVGTLVLAALKLLDAFSR